MLKIEEGKMLVRLARKSMEMYICEKKVLAAGEVPKKLSEPRGVFVTLTKYDKLRGCIGQPFPTMPLVEAVIDSAISSATRDPRFPPVRAEELKEIEIELSVLSVPEEIRAKDPRDYPKHVEVGKDGLIVECHNSAGLLLPQVPVEQNWGVEEYLACACMKAGLPPDKWLDKSTRIQTFSAQLFREKKPGGEIEERNLVP